MGVGPKMGRERSTMTLKSLLLVSAFAAVGSAHAVVLTQWDFNASLTAPSTGVGTLTTVGGIAAPTSVSGFGSSDPAATGNQSASTTGYSTNSGTQGLQFSVNPAGASSVDFSFDLRASNTGSKYVGVFFRTGANAFTSAGTFSLNAGGVFENGKTATLTGLGTATNLDVRILAVAGPTGGFVAANPTSSFSSTGTLRYDMVTFSTQPVPEPASMAALGLGALALIRRRRATK